MIIPLRRSAVPALAGAAALVVNAAAAFYYSHLGLTLSHYDARGHLVVARRVLDSITPGWQQIGAVWLPLPHLLNLLPVQIDALYRTGASGVAISVVAGALAAASVAWIVLRFTGSVAASLASTALFTLNPNLLYLQATPMTEPLLLGLTISAVALLMRWCDGDVERSPWSTAAVGVTIALACLTRYEAWPVTAVAVSAAIFVLYRNGDTFGGAVQRVAAVAIYPAAAALAFVLLSRAVVGEWFTASGFFVPENKSLDRPVLAAMEIVWGLHALTGTWTLVIGTLGLLWLLVASLSGRQRSSALITFSLLATAALPWAAFVKGHPFRIRYMVPLLAVEAIGIGIAVASVRRATAVLAVIASAIVISEAPPLSSLAPMVLEAQWDRPNVVARRHVTDCLRAHDDGETIMASMGSLGHYMQEMSVEGIGLRRFLHEGNGDIWLAALNGPRRFAGWLLIEEKAEGGDMLAHIAHEHSAFLAGYERLCDGAGVVLYRRRGASR